MFTIHSTYADHALYQGLGLLGCESFQETSRNGPVLVMPKPVTTVNEYPMRRVVFSADRDANPFFHYNEALWMLAGRNDVRWLDQFVKNFSERYGEQTPQGTYMHGAYGFRWRKHFDVEGGGDLSRVPDQLNTVIDLLKHEPTSRQAVIAMWDPVSDLAVKRKDIPCNTHIYLRIRKEDPKKYGVDVNNMNPDGSDYHILDALDNGVLDVTVCCRSNDAIWGAHGANIVHFSILQEYLARRIGVGVGRLYQVSNNYHAYRDVFDTLYPCAREPNRYKDGNAFVVPIITSPDEFDGDLVQYFSDNWMAKVYANTFFNDVAVPLRQSYALWRKGARSEAVVLLDHLHPGWDWVIAAKEWYSRRLTRAANKIKLEGDQNHDDGATS